MQGYTTFNLQIPNDRADLISAIHGFIKAFKIENRDIEDLNQEDLRKDWEDFFGKYGGALSGWEDVQNEYDNYRLKRYGK